MIEVEVEVKTEKETEIDLDKDLGRFSGWISLRSGSSPSANIVNAYLLLRMFSEPTGGTILPSNNMESKYAVYPP